MDLLAGFASLRKREGSSEDVVTEVRSEIQFAFSSVPQSWLAFAYRATGRCRLASQLAHDVVHTLCGRTVDYEGKYIVGEESTTPILALTDALQREFVRSVSLGWSESEISSVLQDRGAPQEASRAVATALQARAPELASALEGRGRPIASGRVRDFDWSLRMIMSSSTAADMLEPVLVLTLFTLDARGDEKRVLLELTKEDVDCLLEDMDRIAELVDSIADE